MYYILILTAAMLFSLQFMFNNGFQQRNEVSINSTLKFSLYTAVIGLLLTLVINKFKIEFTLFSLATATVYGLVCIILNYCTIKAFEYASLSVYSIFSMIGGMILPFIYGVLCGEEFKAVRVICCCLIVGSILLTLKRGKQSNKAFIYYISVFVLNGMVGVISTYHQANTAYCVDSASFLMLTKIVISVICLGLLLKDRDFKIDKKSTVFCIGSAGFNSIGNLMLLIVLLHLPASVQYPMVTGGTIAFSMMIDLIRKVKVTKKEVVAAGVALAASILMAF